MVLTPAFLGSPPNIPKDTRPHPTAAQLKESLSFNYFDRLYAHAPEQYMEMLDLYAEEYALYLQSILTAIDGKDETAFRRIKHKIIYSLHLLDLASLHNNMEVLANQFQHLDPYQRITARHAYASAFEFIMESIRAQRQVLSCQITQA